jgi:pilus assembly protein FimV
VGKFPYKAWFLTSVLLLTPGLASAAGLGKLNVLSYLGQPLIAEVDLIAVDKNELASLTAQLGSPEDYSAAGVPYSSALVGVHVSIEKRGDGTP